MDLIRHLRYFVAVAETEHIGRAAESLGLAQPALSQRVKALETHLGTPLIARDGRGIRLTEAGRQLVPRAVAIVAACEELGQGLADPQDDTVVIAVPATLAPARLHALTMGLNDFLSPRTTRLVPMPPEQRSRALASQRVQAALLTATAAGDISLPLGIAVHTDHPLAAMGSIHPSDLAEYRLLVLDEDDPAKEAVSDYLDRHGYPPTGCRWAVAPAAALAGSLGGEPCLTDARHATDAGLAWIPFVGGSPQRELALRWSGDPRTNDPVRLLEVTAETLAGDAAVRYPTRASRALGVSAHVLDIWDGVGVRASAHARHLGSGRWLAIGPEEAWPIASVAKVPLAVALHRAADRGMVRLEGPVTLQPDGRTEGTTGVSAMSDPVALSLRDALYLALTISDNAAADAVWDALGTARIQNLLRAVIDPGEVRLAESMHELYDRITFTEQGLDAPTANRGTAAGLTHLLELIWSDRAAAADGCAQIRELMSRQIWGNRLASGFPATDIQVAGKTGTVRDHRHEIGVISYPDGGRYAVAVLTRSIRPEAHHRWDWAIGETARLMVNALRRGETMGPSSD